MKRIPLGKSGLSVPNIAVGCMRIAQKPLSDVEALLKTAIEHGLNYFDHADIYGGGECERVFAKALKLSADAREKIILQTKCGIHDGTFDFSKEHILRSVEASLERLSTDYIDVLLLHRPDALMEPEEVCEAFEILRTSGKVRHFGVSNQNSYQMKLLQKYLSMPIVANQMQLSIPTCPMIDAGLNVNLATPFGTEYDGGVLTHCMMENITVQAWSPFQHGFFKGCFIDNPQFEELNRMLALLAEKYTTTKTAIAVSWIARHPGNIQTVTGTTNPERLLECARGAGLTITRKEWYELYKSAGKKLP